MLSHRDVTTRKIKRFGKAAASTASPYLGSIAHRWEGLDASRAGQTVNREPAGVCRRQLCQSVRARSSGRGRGWHMADRHGLEARDLRSADQPHPWRTGLGAPGARACSSASRGPGAGGSEPAEQLQDGSGPRCRIPHRQARRRRPVGAGHRPSPRAGMGGSALDRRHPLRHNRKHGAAARAAGERARDAHAHQQSSRRRLSVRVHCAMDNPVLQRRGWKR